MSRYFSTVLNTGTTVLFATTGIDGILSFHDARYFSMNPPKLVCNSIFPSSRRQLVNWSPGKNHITFRGAPAPVCVSVTLVFANNGVSHGDADSPARLNISASVFTPPSPDVLASSPRTTHPGNRSIPDSVLIHSSDGTSRGSIPPAGLSPVSPLLPPPVS